MTKCVECGKDLGPLDIYQETTEGLVCGKCLMCPDSSPGRTLDRALGGATGSGSTTIRMYSVTEQAFLPLVPAVPSGSAETIRRTLSN